MTDRPNILILMTDQHHPGVLGYMGNDIIRTPTLDRLAEDATVFTNAYTPAPVCAPARHAIRTGKYPHTYARDGHDAFEGDYPTYPRRFASHGYMTASAGKEHYAGRSQMQGWQQRLGPTPVKKQRDFGELVEDKQTFPQEFTTNHYFSDPDYKWSATKEIKRAGIGRSRLQVIDERSTSSVEDFLERHFVAPYYDRAQPERPVLLKCSLMQPHFPFIAEDADAFSYYMNRVDPIIASPDGRLWDGWEAYGGTDVTAREVRRATAAYYAMVERVDHQFGRIIEKLRQVGEDPDEWIIVFTADHGELLGEYGLWGKGNFYEASVKAPLFIRYPDRFSGRIIEKNVSLCDLYETLGELADVPTPADLDSQSLIPLLNGETEQWDNEVISQMVGNDFVTDADDYNYDGVGKKTVDLMIKRDHLKYVFDGAETLVDLQEDPDETQNRIGDPDYEEVLTAFRNRRSDMGFANINDTSSPES